MFIKLDKQVTIKIELLWGNVEMNQKKTKIMVKNYLRLRPCFKVNFLIVSILYLK